MSPTSASIGFANASNARDGCAGIALRFTFFMRGHAATRLAVTKGSATTLQCAVLAFALALAVTAPLPAAQQYAQQSAATLAHGRAIEAVLRAMVPLGARVDECVLVAAPDDEDWEADYLDVDGARTGLKLGFTRDGAIAFLTLRARPPLPDDPHARDAPLELRMPVVDRPLVAFSGGPTRMWNQHVNNPDQRHALDLVSWRDGGSFGATLGTKNEDHAIWNARVHAPVDGTVVFLENAAADHAHPHVEWADDAHPFGNVVVIRVAAAPDRFVVLGHMRKGSIVVAVGSVVAAGDVIGRVGNSGNSSEPHLHVHVQDGPVLKAGASVPFLVDGARILRGVFYEPAQP
jgi:hypothetical protein